MKQRTQAGLLFVAPFFLAVFILPQSVYAYQSAPIAITKVPTFITEKGARINGAANPNEMSDTYIWFEWGIAGRSEIYQTTHRSFSGGNQLYDTYEDIYGLAPNVQYFYRIVAESSRGKDVGQTTYFTSKALVVPVDPVVIVKTDSPTAITDSGAQLRAYIAPHESSGVSYWFQWGTSNRFENETPHTNWGRDSGATYSNITGLTSGTTYFYRIVAENNLGQVFGDTRVFSTTGIPPPPPEAPKDQVIQSPSKGDGDPRKVTSSGGAAGSYGNSALPGFNVFGQVFGNKNQTTNTAVQTNTGVSNAVTVANTAAGKNNFSSQNAANTSGSNVVALSANTPVGSFWNSLLGKKAVEVRIEKFGPSKVPQHTPVEYRISYSYRAAAIAPSATLKVILPGSVVYIGDNTNNELLLEESSGGERTYDLPLGKLENGSTRTISILGMTTADANGSFPEARARLEYTDKSGVISVVSSVSSSSGSGDSATGSASGILPSSLIGWLIYVFVIVGLIFLTRKVKAYYDKRKMAITMEEEAQRRERAGSAFGKGQVPAL